MTAAGTTPSRPKPACCPFPPSPAVSPAVYEGGLNRDRYDGALAHVIVKDETGADLWLNG